MSVEGCIHCGSATCRYGACQRRHLPGKDGYREGMLCGNCGRPFELGEQYHDHFEDLVGNNFVSLTVCGDCALKNAWSIRWRAEDGTVDGAVLDPLDGALGGSPVGEFTRRSDRLSHISGQRPRPRFRISTARAATCFQQSEVSGYVSHVGPLLESAFLKLRRFINAHIAEARW